MALLQFYWTFQSIPWSSWPIRHFSSRGFRQKFHFIYLLIKFSVLSIVGGVLYLTWQKRDLLAHLNWKCRARSSFGHSWSTWQRDVISGFSPSLFSAKCCLYSCAYSLSHVWLFVTPWTVVACQTPLSMRILQARILEWVSMPSSRRSSQPRDWTPGLPHCGQILYHLSLQGSP